MPITRSQSRPMAPVAFSQPVQQDMPSPEPPAKRTRSHTKTISDSSTKKPRMSHGNAPKKTVAISPEETVVSRGATSITSSFGFLDASSPFRPSGNLLDVNDEPLPPGVIDIFARDPLGGGLTSTIGSSSYLWQCESLNQELLSHLHLTHYGRDFLLLVRLQESREIRDLAKVQTMPLRNRASPLTRTRSFQFHGDEEGSATSEDHSEIMDMLEDEENDITSDEGEIRSHNVSRYRPRNDVSNRLPHQPELTVQMRRVLVQWMSEVVKEFKLSEATYHLAVTLLDQLLFRGPGGLEPPLTADRSAANTFSVQRNEFQALGWYVVF
jgi:Cyclin, N-terminal domain